ncbi:FAD-linked sulfhydryl oxidase ERV1-like isoform X2 [Hibiscus syriacus]|uniref:FAD-linked sulfhydryl oxidase ERV1-like isoform X2 n=1 Tax=Hibiscus syriacus TaxID=106335 RepID=UPI0019209588|nr:FAD-linked sulfhydryl oxidase ERV1-like isoform X2 [Hibiscus syriacus]
MVAENPNPFRALIQTVEIFSNRVQTHLASFTQQVHHSSPTKKNPLISLSSSVNADSPTTATNLPIKPAAPVTKEELGRATWTFLHTLAAQYPENPTRQQKKDVKELMSILSRMYPCKECADHFKEVLRGNPVMAGSHDEFSQWLCHVHNVVNRSLGKSIFRCERVDARWGKLDCEQRACDLQGMTTKHVDL